MKLPSKVNEEENDIIEEDIRSVDNKVVRFITFGLKEKQANLQRAVREVTNSVGL